MVRSVVRIHPELSQSQSELKLCLSPSTRGQRQHLADTGSAHSALVEGYRSTIRTASAIT
jgi:hypothetical protein